MTDTLYRPSGLIDIRRRVDSVHSAGADDRLTHRIDGRRRGAELVGWLIDRSGVELVELRRDRRVDLERRAPELGARGLSLPGPEEISDLLERLEEILGAVIALLGELVQALQDHGLERRRHVDTRGDLGGPRGGIIQVLVQDRELVLPTEWELPCQDVVQDHAERVEITARLSPVTLCLLGAHELRGPEDRASLGLRTVIIVGDLGDPEVEDLDDVSPPRPGHQHDVIGLEVPVNHAILVSERQDTATLLTDRDDLRWRHRPGRLDRPREALPLDELGDDVERAVFMLTVIEQRDGVGVIHARVRAGFVDEARDDRFIRRELLVQELDRDELADRFVHGLVDLAHPAAVEEVRDREPARDDLADVRITELVQIDLLVAERQVRALVHGLV